MMYVIVHMLVQPGMALSQPMGGSATTESVCRFGMVKGDSSQSCAVPIPNDCNVANFPGTDKPWASVSKGGNTQCRYDDGSTDWKTRITGTCGACKTPQCSAEFSVRFNCSGQGAGAPYSPQSPRR